MNESSSDLIVTKITNDIDLTPAWPLLVCLIAVPFLFGVAVGWFLRGKRAEK